MDIASILGLILCGVLVVFGIVFESKTGSFNFTKLPSFIDVPSMLITFGGTFMCVMASNTLKDFISGIKSFLLILKVPKVDVASIIRQIIDLSNIARKEGLLALEESANSLEDDFMKKGILLIVDGTDPELVRNILETELMNIDARHKKLIAFWKNVGAMGPAWGMIGTLIGLINMLRDLSDPDTIGPNMAVALITTLYGSMLANWVSSPVATKLATNNDIEIMMKEVMIEGLLSIQAGENPRVIEEKLKSFLSPAVRSKMEEEAGES
ncbi:MAG: motility protein A [Bacteroides sp.]|nr:motility protein A [Bacteroides sp.]MCM1550018.1 motility protein A [Clostridium sp.]